MGKKLTRWKRMLIVGLCAGALFGTATTVLAEEPAYSETLLTGALAEDEEVDPTEYLGSILNGSLLTDELEAENTIQPLARTSLLYAGTVKIVNYGDGIIGIGGNTLCLKTCDNVQFHFYLERSRGVEDFYSYKSFCYTTQNANMLAKSLKCVVPKGYYYRLRGYHYAEKNGMKENLGSVTDGIYIS